MGQKFHDFLLFYARKMVFHTAESVLLRLFLFSPEAKRYGLSRADLPALPAADAFRRIRIFRRIYIHLTDVYTLLAAYAFVRINFQMTDADFVEKTVNGSEGA